MDLLEGSCPCAGAVNLSFNLRDCNNWQKFKIVSEKLTQLFCNESNRGGKSEWVDIENFNRQSVPVTVQRAVPNVHSRPVADTTTPVHHLGIERYPAVAGSHHKTSVNSYSNTASSVSAFIHTAIVEILDRVTVQTLRPTIY